MTLLTGAARGIGAAIARELHDRGHRLALMCPAGSKELAEELGHVGIEGSVTDEADLRNLLEAARSAYGHVDGAVINTPRSTDILRAAGLDVKHYAAVRGSTLHFDPTFKPDLVDIPADAWHSAFTLHVGSYISAARVLTPHFLTRGKGSIVNVSGAEALEPRLTFVLGPVRLALHGYAKLYADRYGADGIRMNSVAVGMCENTQSTDVDMAKTVPLGRLAKLSEIASATAFLLSDEASYVTGQVLRVDGGLNRGV